MSKTADELFDELFRPRTEEELRELAEKEKEAREEWRAICAEADALERSYKVAFQKAMLRRKPTN
jgi:hypothetical protein